MQHREVSCAVRRIYRSLGFKGLINVYFYGKGKSHPATSRGGPRGSG